MIGLIRAGATYNFGAVNSTHIGSPRTHLARPCLLEERQHRLEDRKEREGHGQGARIIPRYDLPQQRLISRVSDSKTGCRKTNLVPVDFITNESLSLRGANFSKLKLS
ncbi:MAG: hypothetical protein II650_02685 [Clostridia bacterium]|nr:hypothetical protein [Clostridia bacterium]